MQYFSLGSIRKNLTFLVIVAVLPSLAILLYTGMEQRRSSIETAKKDVMLLTQTMAHVQQDITNSFRQMLVTLSLLPAIQTMDVKASSKIFSDVLRNNPQYHNIALIDVNGMALASGNPFAATSLADRKHFREALISKDFTVGEFILTRLGPKAPVFPFAYPVLDKKGQPIAVLTIVVDLTRFTYFYEKSFLPENSFIALTDHQGVRLFFHPAKENTNPIGKPIKPEALAMARQAREPGISVHAGSDGIQRIFAFQQVRLTPEKEPYIYIWAGVPEAAILKTANNILFRNLLLLSLATTLALILSWILGNRTLILPIKSLVELTKKFAMGGLEQRCTLADATNEFGTLAKAFENMADDLTKGQMALKENEARFRLVMDALDSLVYVSDMDTYEILFINEFGKKIFGDVTGKTCWKSIQENQSSPCTFCTNKSLLGDDGQPKGTHTWEYQNTINNRWYYIHDRAIKWTDGRIVRLEIATDITERKRTETLLAQETERLTVTLQSIADGVITTDTKGRIIFVNQIAEELTGWKTSAAAGRPLNEVFKTFNKETADPIVSPVETILAAGEVINLANKVTLIDKNGHENFISDSGAPIKNKSGKIIGVVLVFRDISEQLRTEQELLKIKKLESIGVLAGGIAHDYNNLLTGILGNIDMSLQDSNLSAKTQNFLNQAQNATFRAKDLTQQLLTFAKGGQPVIEPASLTEVIKDSADFALHGNKVACLYQFPQDLWLVDIDKGQMSQVIQNIIINASYAMPDGGVIEVSCKNVSTLDCKDITSPISDRYVKLKIIDSGQGIPAEVLDKIFDPYFTTKPQGSGLGLAITHSIVNNHSGSISVQSTFGVGTTFTVCLPASAHNVLPAKKVEEFSAQKTNARIMVMDDEEIVRKIAEEMLTAIGHTVLLVKNGTEAVGKYKEAKDNNAPIDIVIMDLTIPGEMGGQEAVKEILNIDSKAKVIVSSGYSEDPAMAFFENYGFCAAIAKPYMLSELTRVVNRFVD